MISISQQQTGQQWEAITPQLREAIFSDVNADFVWTLCQGEGLSEEKSYQVAEFTGYVLFGFIHPEDLAGELVGSVGLPLEQAKKISDKIDSKILTPLRADIDKANALLLNKEVNLAGPKIIQKAEPAASAPIPMPQPQNFSQVGWSKTKLDTPAITTPIPLKNAPSEFDRPKMGKETLTSAPVMLQQETPTTAAPKNVDFRVTKSNENAQMEFSKAKEQMKVRPAVIEFNKNIGVAPKPSTIPMPSTPGHTESKQPLASVPVMDSGARKITEVTSITLPPTVPVPMPKPVTHPTPPIHPASTMPPTPPKPPATPKVIVQDFLQKPPQK